MKKTLLLTICCILSFAASAQDKFVGGDISLLTKYETNGAKYYDLNGNSITDVLAFLKNQGLNSMRVRLFVDPNNATKAEKGQGVCQNLEFVKTLGKIIKDAGLSFMLDFHYSDTWADPSKQWTPKNWETLTDDQLYDKIYEYTKDCLQTLKDAGATPDLIQTGNEISYGMLYGKGIIEEDVYDGNNRYTTYKESDPSYKKVYAGETANWARFISLLKQAGKACREICPNAKIILHTERVPNTSYLNTYYSLLKNEGIDFDIIGLSYYPYHHGPLTNLNNALNILETNFDKDIMIVETGYYHAYYPTKDVKYPKTSFPTWPDTEAGQLQFTKDLIEQLNNHTKVKGLYWWFLEANEYGLDWNTKRVTDDWYNASLFDNSTGKTMSAIAELKSFLGDPSGIETINREPLTVNQHAWYTLDGRKLNGAPNQKGIYIHNGKKMVVR